MTISRLPWLFASFGWLLSSAMISAPVMATDTSLLRQAVTVAGVRTHQAAFQGFADANGGTRFDGSPGHFESADYVANMMLTAGYDVTVQTFVYPTFLELEPAVLEQIAPAPAVYPYASPAGFYTTQGSGNGDVTAATEGVDMVIPPVPTGSSTSGCEASDFAGFTAGRIALIQRGACTFAVKAQNAEAAGASAIVIFNNGTPGRTDAVSTTLGTAVVTIPVVFASFNVGADLATAGVTAHVFVNAVKERTTRNVLAETPGGQDDHVLVVGAHLDSVQAGPGIQDNGSGAAAILEIALQMSNLGIEPYDKVRFAWWGASETGLQGSQYYVSSLSSQEFDKIDRYLHFHMIGSSNFVRFVFDGDGSEFGLAGPTGSDLIENVFLAYFMNEAGGLPTEPTPFNFRSDYAAFFNAGIPVGGLFGGAEGIKTAAQAAIFGGTAGNQYDPCYHLACDTFANISLTSLDQMADAAAHAIQVFGDLGTPAAPVPVMSLWGIISAAMLLLIFGYVSLARVAKRALKTLT